MVWKPVRSYYRTMKFRATQLYVRTRSAANSCLGSERGAGMVEYALLVALIGIVLIVAVSFFSGALNEEFSSIATVVDEV